jgi:methionyl-tRNA formyltransferase
MRITILCSSPEHPVNQTLHSWLEARKSQHDVTLVRKKDDLVGGDILFLIACTEIIKSKERSLFKKCLVVHASNVPQGRGWSPHIWQIVSGAEHIVVSLLEAEDNVDTGAIWKQETIHVPKDALWDEINSLLFQAQIRLMDFAVENYATVVPAAQSKDRTPTYYPRRTPEDSRIDPSMTIGEQFDLIRVCDPVRFPAFFIIHGRKYFLRIEKAVEGERHGGS